MKRTDKQDEKLFAWPWIELAVVAALMSLLLAAVYKCQTGGSYGVTYIGYTTPRRAPRSIKKSSGKVCRRCCCMVLFPKQCDLKKCQYEMSDARQQKCVNACKAVTPAGRRGKKRGGGR